MLKLEIKFPTTTYDVDAEELNPSHKSWPTLESVLNGDCTKIAHCPIRPQKERDKIRLAGESVCHYCAIGTPENYESSELKHKFETLLSE